MEHLNASGLLCASDASCAWCKRCDSCSTIMPGPARADDSYTCDDCTRWLRDIEALRSAKPARKKRERVKAASPDTL